MVGTAEKAEREISSSGTLVSSLSLSLPLSLSLRSLSSIVGERSIDAVAGLGVGGSMSMVKSADRIIMSR